MKVFNRERGKKGEEIAKHFLEKNGYKLIGQNFKNRFGEIDLVATNKGKIIFIEVKLKIGDSFGSPEEMINSKKLFQVQKTAWSFLNQNPKIAQKYQTYRIDAVCIVLGEGDRVLRISHYENMTF